MSARHSPVRLGAALCAALWTVAVLAEPPARLTERHRQLEQRLRGGHNDVGVWVELLDTLYLLDEPSRAMGAAVVAGRQHPTDQLLAGRVARATFRAGLIQRAAQMFDRAGAVGADPVAATVLTRILLAEGRHQDALDLAERGLADNGDDLELTYLAALLQGRAGRHDRAAALYDRCLVLAERHDGYPAALIREWAGGRSAVHRAAGNQTLNQVVSTGGFGFVLPSTLPLPTVEVHVNDQPPARMLLDLSGGMVLSVDSGFAAAAGITALATGQLSDFAGSTADTGWALVERVGFGDCVLQNVVTRIYPLDDTLKPNVQGVIGAGLFGAQRLTMDFRTARVTIAPSSREPTAGDNPLHLVLDVHYVSGDQPLIPVQVRDQPVNAILDIGSPVTCFSTTLLESLTPADRRTTQRIGAFDAVVADGLPVVIGRRTIRNPTAIGLPFVGGETSARLGAQIDVILGWELFRTIERFTLDAPARQIVVDWLPPPPARPTPPDPAPQP